jgi:hypothetical protein
MLLSIGSLVYTTPVTSRFAFRAICLSVPKYSGDPFLVKL